MNALSRGTSVRPPTRTLQSPVRAQRSTYTSPGDGAAFTNRSVGKTIEKRRVAWRRQQTTKTIPTGTKPKAFVIIRNNRVRLKIVPPAIIVETDTPDKLLASQHTETGLEDIRRHMLMREWAASLVLCNPSLSTKTCSIKPTQANCTKCCCVTVVVLQLSCYCCCLTVVLQLLRYCC